MSCLDLTLGVFAILVGLGIESSVIRYYNYFDDPKDKQEVFTTSLTFTFILSLVILGVLEIFSIPISKSISGNPENLRYFRIIFICLAIQNIYLVPEAFLIAQKKSLLYSILSIGTLVSNLSLNIFFLVFMDMGVLGILLSMLITKVLNGLLVSAIAFRRVLYSFSLEKLKKILSFGMPLMPATVGLFIIHFSDRFFIQRFCSLSEVGLYSLGYKFGMILTILVSGPIFRIWDTQRFEIAKTEDGKKVFGRIFTYYSVIIFFAGLTISVFINEIFSIMAAPEYQSGTAIVPLIVLSYILYGIANFFSLGIMITNRTKYAACIYLTVAGINMLFNILLISRYGIMGAAISTFLSFLSLSIFNYSISQKLYPVHFEYGRISILFVLATTIFLISRFIEASLAVSIGLKSLLLLGFPIVLLFSNFFYSEEIKDIKKSLEDLRLGIVNRKGLRERVNNIKLFKNSEEIKEISEKRILMLVPYFAPDASIGTRRSLSLANYLTNRGWNVDVLTKAESDIRFIDTSLHFRVDPKIRIHRVPFVDLFGKLFYPFKYLSRPLGCRTGKHKRADTFTTENGYFDSIGRSMRWLWPVLWPVYMPDKNLQWALRSVCGKRIRQLARKADCIYSSSPPHSVHITGMILKTLSGKPWVIDLRDPWVTNPFREFPNHLLLVNYDRYLEKKVISLGDRIVCATPLMAKDLIERFDGIGGKISFVFNGYDPVLFSEDGHVGYVDQERLKLIHIGSLYGKRDITFLLKALLILKKENPDMAKDFHFEFIGPGTTQYGKIIEEMELKDMVKLDGPISYSTALGKYRQASVCICAGVLGTNIDSQIPAKLYEFISLGKPVFALAGASSSIAIVLKNAGIEYFLADPSNSFEIYSRLKELHSRWKNGKLVYGGNREKRVAFDSRIMAGKLEDILLEVSSKGNVRS